MSGRGETVVLVEDEGTEGEDGILEGGGLVRIDRGEGFALGLPDGLGEVFGLGCNRMEAPHESGGGVVGDGPEGEEDVLGSGQGEAAAELEDALPREGLLEGGMRAGQDGKPGFGQREGGDIGDKPNVISSWPGRGVIGGRGFDSVEDEAVVVERERAVIDSLQVPGEAGDGEWIGNAVCLRVRGGRWGGEIDPEGGPGSGKWPGIAGRP